MERALVQVGRPLKDLFLGLSESQEEYLSLLIRGMEVREARELVGIKYKTVQKWEDSESFTEIERYVIANRGEYEDEALLIFERNLNAQARELQAKILHRALTEWDSLSPTDKKIAAQICTIRRPSGIGGGSPGSYEELILRKHIQK